MSDSREPPWSDNPNVPKIPYNMYFAEKCYFAGILLAAILYGILIVLFFQCIAALFSPANHRKEGVRWCVVCYTMLMFLFVTVLTGTDLHIQSICYVDNREYPGVENAIAPGPLGYRFLISSGALSITRSLMFFLNFWLADGLLLYHCYTIYSKNFWAIAFPCLMYLGSVVTGVMILISQARGWDGVWTTINVNVNLSIPSTSISVSLNTLLTFMIIIRLVLHRRNTRAATGSPAGIGGLYKTITTLLIESSALYAVNSLLLIGLWVSHSDVTNIFLPTLAEIQVIAPLLIIKRTADGSLTSETTVSVRKAKVPTTLASLIYNA